METKDRRPAPDQRRPAARPKAPAPSRPRAAAPGRSRPKNARRRSAQATDRQKREAAARAAKIKAMKQDAQRKTSRRVRRPRRPMQPVIYTQPKAFNRSRLMIQIISILAVVAALVLSLSIFFRVETIMVSGANAYSAWAVREASGIQEGDYLLTFSRAKAAARIEAALPYVNKARIGIKLPNTVNIVIEEIDVVYAAQCKDGVWWLITSKGMVMEQSDAASAGNYTRILGVELDSPTPGQQARAYEPAAAVPEGTDGTTGETFAPLPVTITYTQKFNAALQILQSLELNEIVGEAASVDVTDLTRIQLWYGSQYQVNLGDTNQMDHKIASMKATIAELSDYESGELDVSFTQWPDKVAYTPFA